MLAISRMAATAALGLLVLVLSACGATHRAAGKVAKAASAGSAASGPRLAGDSSLPAGVVALVGRDSITEGQIERWAAVVAVMELPAPTRPLPLGVVPDPPGYGNCIAYLAGVAEAERARPAPDRVQLKQRCALERESLRQSALTELIRRCWEREEARKMGVRVTGREVDEAIRGRFSTEAELHRYLAFTRLPMSDVRFLIGEMALEAKWYRANVPAYGKLKRKGPESEQVASEIDSGLTSVDVRVAKTWTPRTRCRTGYVVSVCGEYKEG